MKRGNLTREEEKKVVEIAKKSLAAGESADGERVGGPWNGVGTVEFCGAELITVEDADGEILVAMKPICEALGLDWRAQQRLMNNDPILSEGKVVMTLPSAGGPQEMVCLPLDYLNGWLFKTNANRYSGERRERILTYQLECYRALFGYWLCGGAVNPRGTHAQLLAVRDELERLREAKRLEGNVVAEGTISEVTGLERAVLVRAHLRSWRGPDESRRRGLPPEPDPSQPGLFDGVGAVVCGFGTNKEAE
jgi:hypothetical protein